jgi:hypothetical protein
MVIAVQTPAGIKDPRGSLTFSNSVRQLSRAGTSRRHLLGEGSSHESAEEALYNSLNASQISIARPRPRHRVNDEEESSEEFTMISLDASISKTWNNH